MYHAPDWVRTVEPTSEPVTLADAKSQCRALAGATDEDDLISTIYIPAARQYIEEMTRRALFTQTWRLTQDGFRREIWLPRAAPLQSVTSVKYYDTDGVQQTLSTSYYRVDTASEPGRVVLNPTFTWPATEPFRGQTVEVTYVCGWESTDSIPQALKVAILLMVDHFYENRSPVQVGVGIGAIEVPKTVDALIGPYTVYWRLPHEYWPSYTSHTRWW